MNIKYNLAPNITPTEFIEVFKNSKLGERKPINYIDTIKGMINHADIIVTASLDDNIIGVARAITDFHYCCYLSDLAINSEYQNHGIGKDLISKVQAQLHQKCKLILLSAPNATEYFPKIGFTQHDSAWTLAREDKL